MLIFLHIGFTSANKLPILFWEEAIPTLLYILAFSGGCNCTYRLLLNCVLCTGSRAPFCIFLAAYLSQSYISGSLVYYHVLFTKVYWEIQCETFATCIVFSVWSLLDAYSVGWLSGCCIVGQTGSWAHFISDTTYTRDERISRPWLYHICRVGEKQQSNQYVTLGPQNLFFFNSIPCDSYFQSMYVCTHVCA